MTRLVNINCQFLGELCEFLLGGEPVFIIRAQDKLAPGRVENYIQEAEKEGASNKARSRTKLAQIIKWQKENPEKVKLPG